MYFFKLDLHKTALAARQRKSAVLGVTAAIALGAILVSRVVVSSDLQRGTTALSKVQANTVVAEAPLFTTVVTHHHSRIVPTLGTDEFAVMSQSAGRLNRALLTTSVGTPQYAKRTYTNTLPAIDDKPRTIEIITTTPMFAFADVGFPHIETSRRNSASRYKPYQRLITVKTGSDGVPIGIPEVRCHGYSAEKTEARSKRYAESISTYADRYAVDFDLIKAVIAQESCFRKHAVSPAGAVGLMQLMPATAEWLGVTDPSSPTQNLKAGIRYLSQLTRRFGSNELALAAYNAGPRNVQRYGGIPPFAETQTYVRKVLHNYHSYRAARKFNSEIRLALL